MKALLMCVVASVALAAGWQKPTGGVDHDSALAVFDERMRAYAALHRSLEEPLPPLTATKETWRNVLARQLLANAIRKARPAAVQGVVFSPDVASAFRTRIARVLEGRDVEALLVDLDEEHPKMRRVRPVVNEPLPKDATHEVPCVLLQVLPALPEDVEYRIVNHDLVLWDIHANLVVDFLPNAFMAMETTPVP